ncbi:MAG TPA: DUF6702 family protein [Gemmatimonadales bacterium]|nr:DUF6702 family protein [Gemmatimonadales bacterium]
MRSLLLVALVAHVFPGRGAGADGAPGTPSALHDIHLTHARMVVEGKSVVCRIRVFRDDAETALRAFSGRPDFKLTAEARADSLFGAYATRKLRLRVDRDTLRFTVTASGAEHDPSSQEVIWYILEAEAPRPVSRLGVLNGLMFELFRDQQNIMQVLRQPSGERKTLYFVSTDAREQEI